MQSEAFFLKFGFRNVTMDDLCKEMGISKKTLYQFFQTKDALVEACIFRYMEQEGEKVQQLRLKASDPVDAFYSLSKRARESLNEISPFVIFDLQKNHPEIWKKFVVHDFEWQYNMLVFNFQSGIDQGYYREDIHPSKVAKLFLLQSEGMLRPRIFEPESMELVEALTLRDELFMRSICTERGLERLNTLMGQSF
jgi:AcrR family transcriptional regulator